MLSYFSHFSLSDVALNDLYPHDDPSAPSMSSTLRASSTPFHGAGPGGFASQTVSHSSQKSSSHDVISIVLHPPEEDEDFNLANMELVELPDEEAKEELPEKEFKRKVKLMFFVRFRICSLVFTS